MTNKEAIEVLEKHISPYDNCKADNEANQAIRLAIDCLKKHCDKCDKYEKAV